MGQRAILRRQNSSYLGGLYRGETGKPTGYRTYLSHFLIFFGPTETDLFPDSWEQVTFVRSGCVWDGQRKYLSITIPSHSVSVCICVFVCVFVYVSVCICAFVCVSVYVSVCICVFIRMSVYVSVCICAFVCVFVSGCSPRGGVL